MDKLKALQEKYISCKNEERRITTLDEQVKVNVLKNNEFFVEGTQERIFSTFDDVDMSEQDYKRYLNLCYEGYLKAGLKVEYIETDPTYAIRKELKNIEDKLINIGIDIMSKKANMDKKELTKAKTSFKSRAKVINLVMHLNKCVA